VRDAGAASVTLEPVRAYDDATLRPGNLGSERDGISESDQFSLDRLERRYRHIHPLKIFLDYFRQLVIGSAIGLVVAATFFLLRHVMLMAVGAEAQLPIEMRVFLVTALASCLVVGFVSLFAVAVRRFWRLGGLIALVLAIFAGMSWLEIGLMHASPAIDVIGNLLPVSPLVAAALFAVAALTVAYYAHLIWVLLRAALALVLVKASERAIMRDVQLGRSFTGGLFGKFWGFPPLYKFARRSSARYMGIILLSIICALLFSIATALPMILWSAFEMFSTVQSKCQSDTACISNYAPYLLSLFWFPLGMVPVCLLLGWGGQRLLQRLLRFSLESLQEIDTRAPVLFLRAFRDDQVPLRAPRLALFGRLLEMGRKPTSLDQLLLEEATSCGPVVGLGNPGDKRPPYGAARGYFDDKTWQEAVADLARHSVFSVICIDDTEGIWWEVGHLVAQRHIEKTLFVIHPRYAGAAENASILRRIADCWDEGRKRALAAALVESAGGPPSASTVVGFFHDRDGGLCVLRSSTFSRFAYLLTLRAFIRERLALSAVSIADGRKRPGRSTA